MHKTVLITVLFAFLAFAAPGQATVIPDNSAVDQYTEGIPTAKGEKSERDLSGSLPPGTQGPLNALGKKGAAAAVAAKATAPSPTDTGTDQTSGLGIWLWLILLASLVAAASYYYSRRRASRQAA